MCDHYPNEMLRKASPQWDVSQSKHEQMIRNALHWQRVCSHADKAPKSAITLRLSAILANILHLMAN